MAKVGNLVPERQAVAGKFEMENDTYTGKIAKIATWAEDADGNAVENAQANKVRVYVDLDEKAQDGSTLTLSRKMNLSTFKNAAFAKFLAAATGIGVTDEAALKNIDTDDLLESPIRVLTAFNCEAGYTNIDQFLSPKRTQVAA